MPPRCCVNGPTLHALDDRARTVVYVGPFGAEYRFEVDNTIQFKLALGEHILIRKNYLGGEEAVVLGTLNGTLWVHVNSQGVAAPLNRCANFDELLSMYDLEVKTLNNGSSVASMRGPFGMTYSLNCSSEVLAPFGLKPKERFHCIRLAKNCEVVGVLLGVLWVSFDTVEACPLPHAKDEDSLRALYGIAAVVAGGSRSPRLTARPINVTRAPPFKINEHTNKASAVDAFGNTIEIDISLRCGELFGFNHGQRVIARRSELCGKVSTVVGVHCSSLYIHTDGDKRVTCCRECTNTEDLQKKYAFELEGHANEELDALPKPPVAKSTLLCWTAFGRCDFDVSFEGCKPFGYFNQDIVKCTRGAARGSQFIVVGVRTGVLWALPSNQLFVIPLRHCFSKEQLDNMYGFIVVGRGDLTLASTAPEPSKTALGGGASLPPLKLPPAEKLSEQDRSVEMPWKEGRMPVTRFYLKAVALALSGFKSAKESPFCFHRFYMANPATLITEALSKMEKVRLRWGEHWNGVAFSNATTQEILDFLVQQPHLLD